MKKLWSIGIIALLFLLESIWRTDAQDKEPLRLVQIIDLQTGKCLKSIPG
jgi:hypothetical protein